MKIMSNTEENDCSVTISPKQKKLKQALLPFQTLSSPDSSNHQKNKKRKLSLSSPSSCKNEKYSKIARKENLLTKFDEPEADDGSDEHEDEYGDYGDSNCSRKDEEKNIMKPNALLKYFNMTTDASNTSVKSVKIDVPIVVLNRCDTDAAKKLDNRDNDDSLKIIDDDEKEKENKVSESKLNEFNANDSEIMTEELMDLDKEESSKASTDGSNVNLDNSDTESDTSSSNDDDKKSNDDADNNSMKENSSSVERTPTDKNIERKVVKQRRLTPKQLEKKIESEKKREERQKLKAEREKQRIEERMKRREKKEAERSAKKKEREEKELKKQMDIEQKQKEKERKEKAKEEDRRKKEEEREAKEEEKRKREEEKLEAERKKKKAASTFKSFFVSKNQEINKITSRTGEEKNVARCNFMPFEIKADMKISPICRRSLDNDEKMFLDTLCENDGVRDAKLYLETIKIDKSKIRRSEKTWPAETKDDDVMILDEDDISSANIVDQMPAVEEKLRPKLLYFSENRRPPYWGTWRKKSNVINSRRPFVKDAKFFDYDIDSDEEWEEEEPGESIHGSDDEKEKDEENPDENEYDVDHEFMVPHGYLSDEEARADEEDDENISPESQKFKLKILGEQFEAERNEKTPKIQPKVIGCIWQGPSNFYPDNTKSSVINFLIARQAWVKETPIILEALMDTDTSNSTGTSTPTVKRDTEKLPRGPKTSRVPDEALPDLIRLLHGNPNGRSFLVKEFITYWQRKHPEDEQQLSQISVGKKIREIARRMLCPEEGPMHLKTCWYVPEEVRQKYIDEKLMLPNKWSYKLTPTRKKKHVNIEISATGLVEKEKIHKDVDREKDKEIKDYNTDKEKKNTPLITLFTKKITPEEMKKQLSVKSTPSSSASPSSSSTSLVVKPSITPNSKPGKRVALISVSRGEQFPNKSSIVNAFMKASTVLSSSSASLQSTTDNTHIPLSQPGGSEDFPITVDDSPVKTNKETKKILISNLNVKSPCNNLLDGDKDSVKENCSTELNNKQEQMDVEIME